MCSKLGLFTATATHWKNGTMPKGDILSKFEDLNNADIRAESLNPASSPENLLRLYYHFGTQFEVYTK